jgi:hypothetical protein
LEIFLIITLIAGCCHLGVYIFFILEELRLVYRFVVVVPVFYMMGLLLEVGLAVRSFFFDLRVNIFIKDRRLLFEVIKIMISGYSFIAIRHTISPFSLSF